MGLVKRTYTDNTTIITADNLNQIQDAVIDNETKIANLTPKTGTTAPTTSTVGAVGQFYVNTANGTLYFCSAITSGSYTWVQIGA